MTVIEIIFAILLILSCVFIIAVVLMQESKQGMSNVISGGSADNYFQKNSGRTKEAKLARATKVAAVFVFVAAIAVNLISVYWGGTSDSAGTESVIGTAGDDSAIDGLDLSDININAELDTGDGSETEDVPAEDEASDDAAAETTAAAE